AMSGGLSGNKESVDALKQSVMIWKLSGAEAFLSWLHAFLAQGQYLQRDYAGALESANAALEHCQRSGESYGASETERVIGLILADPENPNADPERAASAYQRALEIARQQEARWLELRAAYSLAQKLGSRSSVATREILGKALRWFQERGE